MNLMRTVCDKICSMNENRKKNQNLSSKFKFKTQIEYLNSQLSSKFNFKIQVQTSITKFKYKIQIQTPK